MTFFTFQQWKKSGLHWEEFASSDRYGVLCQLPGLHYDDQQQMWIYKAIKMMG